MFKKLAVDFRPSIVVFLVALPLCLGIAMASQAPLSAGILAGIVGGLTIATLSNSELSVSGPSAGLALIVAAAIRDLGDFRLFGMAVFLSGLIQIVFSCLKGGNIGNYFPTAVIKGMLSVIGLILILKQIPHAIGYDSNFIGSENFHHHESGENTFSAIMHALATFDKGCLLVAILSFVVILGWDKYSLKAKSQTLRLIPSALLAVVTGLLVNRFILSGTSYEIGRAHMVSLPFTGGFESFTSQIKLPDFSGLLKLPVYLTALLIAAVGSIESLLSIDAADKIDPQKRTTSKNRELFAQGIGNAVSGLVGGLPITAAIVRTSANVSAGAKSRLSAVQHSIWLLIAVLTIPQVINQIPVSVLAVVLILVGYKLTEPELYLKMYRAGLDQFIPFIVTILAILLTDLLKGIAVGMLVGFLFVVKRGIHRSIVMVHDDIKKHYLIRFMKDISFFEKDKMMRILKEIPENSEVTIDGSKDVFVDIDILGVIEDFLENAPYRNITVEIKKSTTALTPFFKTTVATK
jgi:MFS superfamily sulfate permease-like transporter